MKQWIEIWHTHTKKNGKDNYMKMVDIRKKIFGDCKLKL